MFTALFCCLCAVLRTVASWFGFTLSVGRIGLLSIGDITYTHRKSAQYRIGHISFRPHVPHKYHPYWGVFTLEDYEAKDDLCHVSLGRLITTLWFLPAFFAPTPNTLASVTLDDFRVRVWSSSQTPTWLARLRYNVISTVLRGEHLRVGCLRTQIKFAAPAGQPEREFGREFKAPRVPGLGRMEMRTAVTARGWHLKNWQSRLYIFEEVDMIWRTGLDAEWSSLALVAQSCHWLSTLDAIFSRIHFSPYSQFIRPLLQWTLLLPFQLYKSPTSAMDLSITRMDILFDQFHLRDAEIIHQTEDWVRTVNSDDLGLGTYMWDSVARIAMRLFT
ncbi:hypothetical protein FB107DRAFT_220704 [Schizophyllum commune]